ncbi:MAG: ArsR family transcriptional regulator [Nitrosopumilaceae archaeon]
MARGYQTDEIKQKLVDVLQDSKTGMSGVEIAEKLGVNRITITKYLSVFAAEGLIREKKIGNVNLWFIEEGAEQFQFPDDYYKVQTKFSDYLMEGSEHQAYNLIRNCLHSDAEVQKIITEIIFPTIESTQKLYKDGKIGNSEEKQMSKIISNSIQILNLTSAEENPKKNIIVLAADAKSTLLSDAAAAAFHSDGWKVSSLGDMSSSIDVLFDLDLQKFLGKVWKQKTGIMIVVVFSDTEEGLNFFSGAVNSVKETVGKKLFLVLCGKLGKKTQMKADLISEKPMDIINWCQTTFESSESK